MNAAFNDAAEFFLSDDEIAFKRDLAIRIDVYKRQPVQDSGPDS